MQGTATDGTQRIVGRENDCVEEIRLSEPSHSVRLEFQHQYPEFPAHGPPRQFEKASCAFRSLPVPLRSTCSAAASR